MDRKTFRSAFDQKLQAFFEIKVETLKPHLYDKTLQEIITYVTSFAQWGKRIRPYNVFLWYHACGWTDTEYVRNLSLSMELIQLFALVHDDIADKGVLRHNIPTYHRHLGHWYNDEYVGLSQAMFMGDLLYTWALENFYQVQHTEAVNNQMRTLLNEVIVWEIIDVHLSNTPLVSDPWIIPIKDKLKSWNYSFTRPMLIWATLAGYEAIQPIEELGESIGISFQMRDDLMDIIEPKPNKTPFSDHQEWNQTYILHHALQHAATVDRDYLIATRGKTLDQQAMKKLLDIFDRTWTIDFAKQEVNTRLDACMKQFDTIFPEKNERTENIKTIIQFLYV